MFAPASDRVGALANSTQQLTRPAAGPALSRLVLRSYHVSFASARGTGRAAEREIRWADEFLHSLFRLYDWQMSDFTVEIEREEDGRWISEVTDLPGVLAYGASRDEAVSKAKALAFRVLADRLEHGEDIPEIHGVFAVQG